MLPALPYFMCFIAGVFATLAAQYYWPAEKALLQQDVQKAADKIKSKL